MSIIRRLDSAVVAVFAVVFIRAPALVRVLNPVMGRLLRSRLPAGPNVLLQVRGRRSGRQRTFPVAFLDLGGRAYVQAASADDDWVHNLRAAGEAVIIKHKSAKRFLAIELDPETCGRLLQDLLAPFPRSRLVRAVVGSTARPPVGVLHYFRLRVDDTLEEYTADARRQPVFELHSVPR